jgi:hypothetical protein
MRRFASVFSAVGTAPVSFSKACRRTIRFPGALIEDAIAGVGEAHSQLTQLPLDL